MKPLACTGDDEAFRSFRRVTKDADDHASCLRNWDQQYDQLTAGAFEGDFEEYWFENLQIFRERTNQSVREVGQPWKGSRTFGIPVEIDGTGWFCGETLDVNSFLTLKGGDEMDFRTPKLQEIIGITADAQTLNDYAFQVEHRDLEAELEGKRILPSTPEQAATLRDFLGTVLASLRATPEMLRHAAMRKALEQAIYGSLINAINPNLENRAAPSCRARQLVVERAREYMSAHIEEPITVADLCAELRVSRRTLQYSFQDVLNLNPVSFLRALRLNGVRRALKRAPAEATSVADIAACWGFWHLSHFASDYKAMFGELPSETLKGPTSLIT
ncbi:helix-turn-helix domain-containing protein [Azoarcus sp. L1K30]|uniref:helix-turn-helix domain-containing protein n=1 Tax=Azoarcus sp. L1K30 TaxID=2820277 RepID=UPI001B83E11B|nr:helix-turn-helix domain-containing protein [Azoarcus sp. L1K30]MBR0566264.1 helix-turn-helix domain-containing protein [Azoarcus sp. L1K30]